jgi:hypothetical protein
MASNYCKGCKLECEPLNVPGIDEKTGESIMCLDSKDAYDVTWCSLKEDGKKKREAE